MADIGGRPLAKIDWNYVAEQLEAGNSGADIAAELGIVPNTLYARCVTDNNMTFSEYSQQMSSKGINKLKTHQYRKALGLTDIGDNTLLIWLGKVRCKQKDESQITQSGSVHVSVNGKLATGLPTGIDIRTTGLSNTTDNSAE